MMKDEDDTGADEFASSNEDSRMEACRVGWGQQFRVNEILSLLDSSDNK